MAFEEYTIKSGGKTGMTPKTVAVSVCGKKNLSISIVIGHELMTEWGWAKDDKVSLYFGTEEDKGKLLVKKTPVGITITDYTRHNKVPIHHGQIMRKVAPIAPIEDFAGNQLPSRLVEHAWDKEAGGLVVTLPEGFFTV